MSILSRFFIFDVFSELRLGTLLNGGVGTGLNGEDGPLLNGEDGPSIIACSDEKSILEKTLYNS